jgi:hypothetical protein
MGMISSGIHESNTVWVIYVATTAVSCTALGFRRFRLPIATFLLVDEEAQQRVQGCDDVPPIGDLETQKGEWMSIHVLDVAEPLTSEGEKYIQDGQASQGKCSRAM